MVALDRNLEWPDRQFDISERRKCYVYGQCEVSYHAYKYILTSVKENHLFKILNRSTLSTSNLHLMSRVAISSAAPTRSATGGLGSPI